MDVLRRHGDEDVLLVSVGAMAPVCLDVADRLVAQGIGVTAVDPRWVKPVDPALPPLATLHRLVVTVEDNGRIGGVGSSIAQALRDAGVRTPLHNVGIPPRFLEHGKPAQVHAECGLTGQDIARDVVAAVARLDDIFEPEAGHVD
jgi:1-deoxy-D-xylulose-5-phosphate synthase